MEEDEANTKVNSAGNRLDQWIATEVQPEEGIKPSDPEGIIPGGVIPSEAVSNIPAAIPVASEAPDLQGRSNLRKRLRGRNQGAADPHPDLLGAEPQRPDDDMTPASPVELQDGEPTATSTSTTTIVRPEAPDFQLEDSQAPVTSRRVGTPDRAPAVKRTSDDDDDMGEDCMKRARRISVDESMETPNVPQSPAQQMTEEEHFWMFGNVLDVELSSMSVKGKLQMVDLRILQSWLCGVDITEVISPVRVAEAAAKMGLTPGTSFDLTNGWNFELEDHRRRAWKQIKEEDPLVVIGSPPCTLFSIPYNLCINQNEQNPEWMAKYRAALAAAEKHVVFCCAIYRYQLRRGRRFLHEHPWSPRSWKIPQMKSLEEDARTTLVRTDMCRFGMETHILAVDGGNGNVLKPTGFLT